MKLFRRMRLSILSGKTFDPGNGYPGPRQGSVKELLTQSSEVGSSFLGRMFPRLPTA